MNDNVSRNATVNYMIEFKSNYGFDVSMYTATW